MKENSCYDCEHKQTVPANCHIRCSNPDRKMTGNEFGIRKGWFMYPFCFDPTWMTKECSNFKPKEK